MGDLMSRNRYELISRCIYCALPEEKTLDRRISKFYDIIRHLCKIYYYPGKFISVNECMISYQGSAPHSMVQYQPCKPVKWGFKEFVIADSANEYTWDFALYTDLSRNEPDVFIRNTVLRLLDGIEAGHILYVDSYYPSVELAQILTNVNIDFVGTVRKELLLIH